MKENRANEQNQRMREWFKQRTGLKTGLLSVHMKEIDRLLLKENAEHGCINVAVCEHIMPICVECADFEERTS